MLLNEALGTAWSSVRGDTKGGLLRFSRGQKDVSVPPSLPFTPREQNGPVLIFRMSIQAQSDGPIGSGFYTLPGWNCVGIKK